MTTFQDQLRAAIECHQDQPSFDALMDAAQRVENGSEFALLELVRFCRSNYPNTELMVFSRIVLSACHNVCIPREKYECAKVCLMFDMHDDAYELLKELCGQKYWPAMFKLGMLIETTDLFPNKGDDGLELLRVSSEIGPVDGLFAYYTRQSRRGSLSNRVKHFLKAVWLVPRVFNRIETLGEPEDRSQILE